MRKKLVFVFLILTLLLGLCSCGALDGDTYMTSYAGKVFYVDTANGTILFAGIKYGFEIDGDYIRLTYPGGEVVSRLKDRDSFFSNMAVNGSHYDENGYILPEILAGAAQQERESGSSEKSSGDGILLVLAAVLVIGSSIFAMAKPEIAGYYARRWRYKNAEPSEAGLLAVRAGGVFTFLLGIILLFFAFFA